MKFILPKSTIKQIFIACLPTNKYRVGRTVEGIAKQTGIDKDTVEFVLNDRKYSLFIKKQVRKEMQMVEVPVEIPVVTEAVVTEASEQVGSEASNGNGEQTNQGVIIPMDSQTRMVEQEVEKPAIYSINVSAYLIFAS